MESEPGQPPASAHENLTQKKRNVRLARQGSKVVGLSHDFGLAGPDSKEVGSPLKLIGNQ